MKKSLRGDANSVRALL